MNDAPSSAQPDREQSGRLAPGSTPGGRLVRRTFLIALALVSGGLLTSGAVELVFRYRESSAAIGALQGEMAQGAAFKIQQFVQDITQTLRASTQTQELIRSGLTEALKFELLKLLKIAPAITEVVALDSSGHEQFKVSRVRMLLSEDLRNRASAEAFQGAHGGRTFFGNVYFVRESEPYMTIAVPIERFAGDVVGVLTAEVNLKYIWDVVSRIKAGQTGYAYVVSREGDLIAHPDISMVLQKRQVRHLGQVAAALSGTAALLAPQANLAGQQVFAVSAAMPELGWAVLVERPVTEAYAPLYASLRRTVMLLLLGLGMAVLASLLIGRRVVRPLALLQEGVARIGRGDLAHRLAISTGDEFQALADEFNRMTTQLQALYTGLEHKVQERTRELQEKGQQLEIASKHKSQFLANMSHELRTPLNAILGYTELINDEIYGAVPEKIREILEHVQQSGRHLLDLINDVLDISKMEAGQLDLFLADYSLAEVVQTVCMAVESLATGKRLALKVDLPAELPLGRGDERRLAQVLLNLVGNAIKFTEAGEVQIQVAATHGIFEVGVSDTGPGISETDQQKIFEEFQQADSSSTRSKSGTGLGLAIVKRIIEMHGGRVWVESSLGQGSTFWFTLPVRVEQQEEAA